MPDGGQAGVTRSASRVTHGHHEIAVLKAGGGDFQIVRRRIRDVVLRVVRGLPVRADVGAVEGEVARMPRPAPVVDVAAVLADGVGRRIRDAHVADLQAPDQLVLQPAEKRRGLAAVARFRLAFPDQRLSALLDLREALARRQRRVQSAGHLLGNVVHLQGDVNARPRSGREFVGRGGGEEAVFEVVVLAGGIELHRAARAMMVGYHQAVRRDKGGGAAAQRDHGPHGERRQVRQRRRIQLQPRSAQVPGNPRNLLRREHAFPGQTRRRQNSAAESSAAHGNANTFTFLHIGIPLLPPTKAFSRTPLAGSLIAG